MTNPLHNLRVARVSTIPFSMLTQLGPQLAAINRAGCQITLVASADDLSEELVNRFNYCEFRPLMITREINFFADIVTLFKLWQLFRSGRFHIVHSITPKAGFLCSIASKLAGVPIRLHTYTGQPWITMQGIKRSIVRYCDKLIARLNTFCYTDSFSQRDFLIKNCVVASRQIKVIGQGSLAGVDITRFSMDCFSPAEKNAIRDNMNLPSGSMVFLFVGRVTEDKGIYELLAAFGDLLVNNYEATLLIVGPFEQQFEPTIRKLAGQLGPGKVIFTGFNTKPEQFMAVADVLCIPSYREGFGTVVIEAAAMGIPAIGTRIYGLTDAVIDNETGILVDPKNVPQLAVAMENLLSNEELRRRLGENAKKRAISEFDSKKFGELLVREYEDLLK